MSRRGDAAMHGDADELDRWNAAADERQRLSDEREQLANEREHLADERERLGDELERFLDQRYTAHLESADPGAVEGELALLEAEGKLRRADARLERAISERARAKEALAREELHSSRNRADTERSGDQNTVVDDEDDARWYLERSAFVATERDRLADQRVGAQDSRDERAELREGEADERDRESKKREQNLSLRDNQRLTGIAATRPQSLSAARSELAPVRDAAGRQRRVAAQIRRRAALERTEAREHGSSFAPDAYGARLAAEFIDLTRELFATQRLSEVADRTLAFALECLPDYAAASLTILSGRLPTLRIATDPVAEQLDSIQLDRGLGPMLDAVEMPQPIYAESLAPWPDLAPRATELGICGALALGLSVPSEGVWQPLGVITLYADVPSPLDPEVLDLASVFAAYLSVAAALDRDRTDLGRREAALHRALSTRDVIGQAKGILMERQHISAGQAFDILKRTSQRLNRRLHEVAALLAETGEAPE